MLSALVLCSGLIAALPTEGERAEYEAARARAGRDTDAHVKLALWCEQHGMTAARARHLALAVLTDPKNAVARGLMGFVQFQGGWRRPDDVAAKVKADAERAAKFAAYAERRARTPHTADGQWKLALWCEEQGLTAEATAHLWATIRLDPGREAAWKRLGYKKQGRRWVTDAQLTAEKQERSLQEKADRHWKPLLEKWRSWLKEKDRRREEAEQALAQISDPRAVPMIWAVFAGGGEAGQRAAVRLFGQIDAPSATRDLALLALFSPSGDVRARAVETLDRRDLRDFGGLLIGFIGEPIKYTVRSVNGPGSQGELLIEGKQAKLKRLYSPPSAPKVVPGPNDIVGYDSNGLPLITRPFQVSQYFGGFGGTVSFPVPSYNYDPTAIAQRMTQMFRYTGIGAAQSDHAGQLMAHGMGGGPLVVRAGSEMRGRTLIGTETFSPAVTEIPIGAMILYAQATAMAAQAKLVNDVQSVERYNAPIQELNERITGILKRVSGQDFGTDREAWQKWYVDLLGFAAQPQMASPDTPVFVENVPLDVPAPPIATTVVGAPDVILEQFRHSCFGRGTLVRTLAGVRPIESILPGDQVLTQDGRIGLLTYQPVLRALHNPPNKTLAVTVGSETIVATGIHRFWMAGHGWVMARDLKPGDPIRTVGGVASVSAIEDAPVQPVFNLEVANGQSFFVGKQGTLVHDNSLVQPVTEPFDAPPELAATGGTK